MPATGKNEGDMPHEKINHRNEQQLVVGWNPAGWVQVGIYPEGWGNTGEATHVGVSPAEIDLLIKTLRRAKRQAYRGDAMDGFEDKPGHTKTEPLFKDDPTD